MTPTTLQAAIRTAEEFLRQAKAVEVKTAEVRGHKVWIEIVAGKHPAAAKRASLDLTRALADMRRLA